MRSRSLALGTAGPGRTLEPEYPVLGGEQAEGEKHLPWDTRLLSPHRDQTEKPGFDLSCVSSGVVRRSVQVYCKFSLRLGRSPRISNRSQVSLLTVSS